MPSVPSRLAVVLGCVLALGLCSPALADKDPNKGGPPGLTGLAPPGQSSGGQDGSSGSSGAPPQVQPQVSAPSTGGGSQPYYTPKMNKGKGNGNGSGHGSGSQPMQPRLQGPSNYQPKLYKHKDASPQAAPVTDTGASSSAATATPAGGTTTAPPPAPAPSTPGGAVAAPKQPASSHKKHSSSHRRHRAARSPRHAAPRITAPVVRRPALGPVTASRPAAPAPKRATHSKPKPQGDSLSGLHVSVVTRTVHDIVRVIPAPVKAVIGAMAALLLAAIAAWAGVTIRARRLRHQRGQLLQEVGLLQAALLPEVPARIGRVAASVAYRPADGPGAGGDFYDVFALDRGAVGVVLGDVAGHGRDALARTALLRYTLRAYLETGLEPRTAMRLAGETLEHNLGAGFATAAVAVYDPSAGTLTYSCAGHPPPILVGPSSHEPVIACSAPPIGVGERTGIRQTTVALPAGSLACFFTDGLAEARVNGELFGRERLEELIASLGETPDASELIEAIRDEVHHIPDDMATCLLRPLGPVAVGAHGAAGSGAAVTRIEELELRPGGDRDLRRFLAACGIPPVEIGDLIRSADARAEDYGGAIVRVTITDGARPRVSLVLPVVETLESAARR
jgi:stage II sporulation SpoE-like protein